MSTIMEWAKKTVLFLGAILPSNYEIVLQDTIAGKIISIIKNISPSTYLVGFKLLDNVSEENLINTAVTLKEKNNCNLVVANDLEDIRQGNHKAFIIKASNDYIISSGKEDIAQKLIGEIFKNDKL